MSIVWRLIHSSHAAHYAGSRERVLCYDAPLDESMLSDVAGAHLWAPREAPLTELPALVSRLCKLERLSIGPGAIDAEVFKSLRAEHLPASLRSLSLHPQGNSYTWQAGPMPQLESLTVNATLKFKPEDLPGLRSLSAIPDRKGALLDSALQLPLTELNLWNVPFDESLFARLNALPLHALGLLGGRTLTTLSGIEQLPALGSLRLKNLAALHTIQGLTGLPALQRLDIQYCKRIADIAVLHALSSLQDLTLVGCGNIGLGAGAAVLRARLPQANIAATQ